MDEAKIILEDAARVLRAHDSDAAVFAEIHLARVSLESGEAEKAIEALDRGVAEALDTGQSEFALVGRIYLASAHASQGEFFKALEILDAAELEMDQGGDLYEPLLARVRAAALRDLGQVAQALDSAAAGYEAALRLRMDNEGAQLQRIVSELSG